MWHGCSCEVKYKECGDVLVILHIKDVLVRLNIKSVGMDVHGVGMDFL